MQFRSYTYDFTEIDVQYALDSKGMEIREIQLDEAYTGENLMGILWEDKWMDEGKEKERVSAAFREDTVKSLPLPLYSFTFSLIRHLGYVQVVS